MDDPQILLIRWREAEAVLSATRPHTPAWFAARLEVELAAEAYQARTGAVWDGRADLASDPPDGDAS